MAEKQLRVWVLAASTGGVDAVAGFLKEVPKREDVAMVYVQHLDPRQHLQLLKIVERHSDWCARGVAYGAPLKGGWVTVPSADERFDIGDDGLLGVVSGDGWQPPYSPNIDEVAINIANGYGASAGIILFSGMGSDGCRGAQEIARQGGKVWIQDPRTCGAVSMPQSVMAHFPQSFIGSPQDLANKFNQEICGALS
jgi:Chemotaxis response regulator containing a CheY-like receiver domain and a methylesterase domain